MSTRHASNGLDSYKCVRYRSLVELRKMIKYELGIWFPYCKVNKACV